MNQISKFAHTSSTTATSIGSHVLAIPGLHESAALTDMCPQCGVYGREPASVLDVTRGNRVTGRVATYQCTACQACWLCHWGPPAGPNRLTEWDIL